MDFKKLLNIINSQPQINALEITDVDLKFCRLKRGEPFFYSIKLESGVIADGKVIERDKLIGALRELKKQIPSGKKKRNYVIVNISDGNIYTQLFNLPPAADANMEEAVRLNLQMLSPIDFANVYSDWQFLNNEKKAAGEIEVLGAFVQKEVVDNFDYCLMEAGFMPVAIEFGGLALSRLAKEGAANIGADSHFILFSVGVNGLGFSLVKNGNIYFNHFVSWQSIYKDQRQVSFDSFKDVIIEEIKKVMGFYATHWGGQVSELYLITYGLKDEIIELISKNFSFKIQTFTLSKYSNVSQLNFSVLGSALRGLVLRSLDTMISLSKIGTEKEFHNQKVVRFIKIWSITVCAFLILLNVIFGTADIFLMRISVSLGEQRASLISDKQAENIEVQKFQEEIINLNSRIDLAIKSYNERSRWSVLFEKIKLLTPENVDVRRIFIQSINAPVLITAHSADEQSAIDFKNKLAGSQDFKNVDLPINRIVSSSRGVDFTIILEIKSL